jgi:hypothetical protein
MFYLDIALILDRLNVCLVRYYHCGFLDLCRGFLDLRPCFLDLRHGFLDLLRDFLDLHRYFLDLHRRLRGGLFRYRRVH